MSDTAEPLTLDSLLEQLRAANGMIIETNRGPLTYEYTAMLPLPRKISPLMFGALEKYLKRVTTRTNKKTGVITKTYKLRAAQSLE